MYAAVSDMTSRFEEAELVQVTDQDGTGAIVEAVVLAAISDATTEINTYAGRKYAPAALLAAMPPMLTNVCCDIARYELFKRKGEMPQVVQDAYNAAIKWLKNLADGTTVLDVGGIEVAPAVNTIQTAPSIVACMRDKYRGL
ncbi:hypothetical protein MMA231_00972 [Asticcacaulis sp. MM231]|uniref:gp436 family protein n=1 Tax=Asticcacaulis sp. MM231 TaxID=3157666 RepID=UPI0032D5743F